MTAGFTCDEIILADDKWKYKTDGSVSVCERISKQILKRFAVIILHVIFFHHNLRILVSSVRIKIL